jgi:hypothetical protein
MISEPGRIELKPSQKFKVKSQALEKPPQVLKVKLQKSSRIGQLKQIKNILKEIAQRVSA